MKLETKMILGMVILTFVFGLGYLYWDYIAYHKATDTEVLEAKSGAPRWMRDTSYDNTLNDFDSSMKLYRGREVMPSVSDSTKAWVTYGSKGWMKQKIPSLPTHWQLLKNDQSEWVLRCTHFHAQDMISWETEYMKHTSQALAWSDPAYYVEVHQFNEDIHSARIFSDSLQAIFAAADDVADAANQDAAAEQKRISDSIAQEIADHRFRSFKKVKP